MNLKTLFWDNRVHVAFTLSLVWLLAVWHTRTINSLIYPLLAIGTVVATDLLITWSRDHKIYFPTSPFVSGFLIGLIIAPTEPFWIIIAASIFASLSKQFINLGTRQHIFNPAAFGILAVSVLFQTPVAWWAVAWSALPLLIIVPLMLRILWKMKRLYLPLMFLAVYFLYLALFQGFGQALISLFDGTVFLFAMVMVPEPITSPTLGNFKYLFGTMVAVLVIIYSSVRFFADSLLPALLSANLLAFYLIRSQKTPGQPEAAKAGQNNPQS